MSACVGVAVVHTIEAARYQDFFYGKPHINIVVQDAKRENRNVAVVSVLRPPDGVMEQVNSFLVPLSAFLNHSLSLPLTFSHRRIPRAHSC